MTGRITQILQRGILRAFAGTMAVAVPAKGAQLALALLLAPRLGPEGYGLFVFALGAAQLGGRLGALGWPLLTLRMIPAYVAQGDWDELRGLLRIAAPVVLMACGAVAAVLAGITWLFLPEDDLTPGLLAAALLLPVIGLRSLMRNMLAGRHHAAAGIGVDELLPPALTCLAVLALGLVGVEQALTAYTLVSLLAMLFGAFYLRRHLPPELARATPRYHLRQWTMIALPALVGMSAKLLMNRTDVIMIAPLSDLGEVGLYGAALRVTFVQTFPIAVLSTVLAPRMSAAISWGRLRQVRRLYFGGLIFAGAISGGVAAALVVWQSGLMGWLFGADYAAAGPVLAVLALAQVAASLGIPATSFLLMSGRERIFGALTLAALVLNVLLNLALIPRLGGTGAAWATLASASLLAGIQIAIGLSVLRRWARSPQNPPVPAARKDDDNA